VPVPVRVVRIGPPRRHVHSVHVELDGAAVGQVSFQDAGEVGPRVPRGWADHGVVSGCTTLIVPRGVGAVQRCGGPGGPWRVRRRRPMEMTTPRPAIAGRGVWGSNGGGGPTGSPLCGCCQARPGWSQAGRLRLHFSGFGRWPPARSGCDRRPRPGRCPRDGLLLDYTLVHLLDYALVHLLDYALVHPFATKRDDVYAEQGLRTGGPGGAPVYGTVRPHFHSCRVMAGVLRRSRARRAGRVRHRRPAGDVSREDPETVAAA
jgi:hypothetical protein